ncbi:hypothetical protein T08_11395 [Trichinella sp. T8]|uniref:Uncharacterized protein n=1 Tax=Trichinella murrelli TaxID=144512 RepID=A0A0V0T9P5_9BILA|nr:hypothetical protein T05_2744 [Trichinella murrelli]KRZ89756.1 hypothetical protein T08_11395 [Trichinella sp. T8]
MFYNGIVTYQYIIYNFMLMFNYNFSITDHCCNGSSNFTNGNTVFLIIESICIQFQKSSFHLISRCHTKISNITLSHKNYPMIMNYFLNWQYQNSSVETAKKYKNI